MGLWTHVQGAQQELALLHEQQTSSDPTCLWVRWLAELANFPAPAFACPAACFVCFELRATVLWVCDSLFTHYDLVYPPIVTS